MGKRWLALALAAALGAFMISPGAVCEPLYNLEEQDAKVDGLFKRYKTVGGALIVSYQGEIVYQRYYGYEDRARKTPVTRDTYFRLASITKLVTGIGVMQLVEKGSLDLDAPIGEYLGYTVENLRFKKGQAPITLRQLMTHTAALNEYGGYQTPGLTLKEMLSREEGSRVNYLDKRPGAKMRYSNFGGGIVGALMEAVTGQSVNAYMLENVFGPLSIDAAYAPIMLKDTSHVSVTYAKGGRVDKTIAKALSEGYEDFADPERHYRSTAGSLWMRPYDLCRLMTLMYQGGTGEEVTLLRPESVQEMCREQKGVGSVTGKTFYGLFTFRAANLFKDKVIYGHQGMSAGFVSNAFFDPEAQLAVVVLTNGCDQRQADRISLIGRAMLHQSYTMLGLESFK